MKSLREIRGTFELMALMFISYYQVQEESKYAKNVLCVDPYIASLNVRDITQTSVTVSWSTRQTRVVNSTAVYYRVSGTTSWVSSPASEATMHTVSTLQPGTQYQFYAAITSYGKSSTSDTVNITTGKCS